MRKGDVELLAPAGSYEALVAAVQSGANAVYVGGKQFGARAFANNFDNETMQKAIEYCHLRDVSLYVTVNTLYTDDQFHELIEYITFLYQSGIDAFIVQDMGLFHLIKNYFPDAQIHMSTQASVKNLEGVLFFEEKQVDRVVLARELYIKDIEDIAKNTHIDLEVFVHGALCMSYSGQCLMSSMIAKRSGNKGKCGQPCRLPYELIENGEIITGKDKYLLSPQDLCSIEHVGELIDAGVKSFKIEGRMKRPEYVYSVVSAYRKAIDAYQNKKQVNLKDDIIDMKKMFNRGFTEGFLFQNSLSLAKSIPGNQGIYLGHIHHYQKNRKLLYITLNESLSQNDRIYFPKDDLTRTITKLYNNNKLINHAQKGELIAIELDSKIDLKQDVYKVIDYELIQNIQNTLKTEHIQLPVDIELNGEMDKPLQLTMSCLGHIVTVYSQSVVEKALKTPLSSKRLKEQLCKLGNTIYRANHVFISFPDQGIISIKEINELRRKAIEQLNSKRLNNNRLIKKIDYLPFYKKDYTQKKLAVKVSTKHMLDHVNINSIDQIFIPFYEYEQYSDKIIPYVPFLYDKKELMSFIHSPIYKQIKTIMVSDLGAYQLMKNDKKIILNANFNIANSFSLKEFDCDCVLSLEMSQKEINNLHTMNQLYLTSYTKIVNMNLKHCIISDHYFHYKNKHCSLCQKNKYQLKDRKGELFDIITDPHCHNYILNNRSLYLEKTDNFNVDYLLLDFINEEKPLIENIIHDFQMNVLQNKKSQLITSLDTFRGYY